MKRIPLTLPAHRLCMLVATLLAMACFTACEDDESDLGINLVDPTTLYNGKTHTLYPNSAWSAPEDSLLTSNTSIAIIGSMTDAVFGKTTATLFTQVILPSETRYLDFDSVQIDSVVLSLTKYQLQPDTAGTYNMHFEVKQLAQPFDTSKSYCSTDELPVDEGTLFYDGTITLGYTDSVVRLMLDRSIIPMLTSVDMAANFASAVKGLRIRATEESGNGMLSIDLSTTATCITAYYHYTFDGEEKTGEYAFLIGGGALHFNQYIHDYSGTPFATNDSVGGANRLYLGSLGGPCIYLNFDTDLRAFHEAHPLAVVHHAELRLPLAPESSSLHPDRVLTRKIITRDSLTYINDMIDFYTLIGYDGTYCADSNHYRMRVTQHLQGLLRQGNDPGMQLLIDSRRHTSSHAIVYGTADKTLSPKIIFVYTE